jgi:hypothetical protein
MKKSSHKRRRSHSTKVMSSEYLSLGLGALGVTVLTAFANSQILSDKTQKLGQYVTPILASTLGSFLIKNKTIATGMYAGSALLIAQNLIKDIAPDSGIAKLSVPMNSNLAGSVSDPLAGEYMLLEGEEDDSEVFGEDDMEAEMLGEDSFVVSGSVSDPLA